MILALTWPLLRATPCCSWLTCKKHDLLEEGIPPSGNVSLAAAAKRTGPMHRHGCAPLLLGDFGLTATTFSTNFDRDLSLLHAYPYRVTRDAQTIDLLMGLEGRALRDGFAQAPSSS